MELSAYNLQKPDGIGAAIVSLQRIDKLSHSPYISCLRFLAESQIRSQSLGTGSVDLEEVQRVLNKAILASNNAAIAQVSLWKLLIKRSNINFRRCQEIAAQTNQYKKTAENAFQTLIYKLGYNGSDALSQYVAFLEECVGDQHKAATVREMMKGNEPVDRRAQSETSEATSNTTSFFGDKMSGIKSGSKLPNVKQAGMLLWLLVCCIAFSLVVAASIPIVEV